MLSDDTRKLEYAYGLLNDYYFGGELPTVMITIQSSKGVYGYCTTQKVWASADENYYELNLGAEYLNRPIENVLATLVHEMVHIYCMENGLKDTSNLGRYHNKIFKREAEKRGLIISQAPVIGWSKTSPSPEFIAVIHQLGLDQQCENYRMGGTSGIGGNGLSGGDDNGAGTDISGTGKTTKKSSTRKYQCPVCGISCRATKDINIMCMDCGIQMVKVGR
jgi:hypothetical protein